MGKRNAQAQEQEALAAQQQAPPAAAPQSPDSAAGGLDAEAMKRLKELADLHEQGVLTDEEFAAQKARILGD